MLKQIDKPSALTTETQIGNTTYIVSSSFSPDSKDTAVTKMAKVLESEMRAGRTSIKVNK